MIAFLETMPEAYPLAFTTSEVAQHAEVVARRGAHLVHAEICVGKGGEHVCMVGEDRPGLLALVTDALLVHGLSIRNAKVYCRRREDGRSEAVDFFELQQARGDASAGIGTAELGEFLQTLSELIAEDVLAASRPSTIPPPSSPATRVYFELEALRRGKATLLVEAPDSEGLQNAISNALHAQNVHIRAGEIRTEGGVASDLFDLVGNDAEPLSAVRLCDIQQAVHAAIPKVGRR